jgi:hypothetical protein
MKPKPARWTCPSCRRLFARKGQAHACRAAAEQLSLRNRPEAVVQAYQALAARMRPLGPMETFEAARAVLYRTARIFADIVVMTDGVRIALHAERPLEDPVFFKVVSDGRKVTHVAKLRDSADVERIARYLAQAYAFSLR